MDLAIGAVAVSPLVYGVVEVAERAGLPSKDAGMVAVLVGAVCGLGYFIASHDHGNAALVGDLVAGLWSGLGAVGIDQTAKRVVIGGS